MSTDGVRPSERFERCTQSSALWSSKKRPEQYTYVRISPCPLQSNRQREEKLPHFQNLMELDPGKIFLPSIEGKIRAFDQAV